MSAVTRRQDTKQTSVEGTGVENFGNSSAITSGMEIREVAGVDSCGNSSGNSSSKTQIAPQLGDRKTEESSEDNFEGATTCGSENRDIFIIFTYYLFVAPYCYQVT